MLFNNVQPMVFMALKIAHDMGVFPVLEKATSPVSAKELAAVKQADPLLVRTCLLTTKKYC